MEGDIHKTISTEVSECYRTFDVLLDFLRNSNELAHGFEYQFDRFRLWSGNIGAQREGKSSMDFRLRDASQLKETVLSMLSSMRGVMLDC